MQPCDEAGFCFPRTRGDVPRATAAEMGAPALPPHARGCTGIPILEPDLHLASPARAGMYQIRPSCCLYLTDMGCDRYPEADLGLPGDLVQLGPPPGDHNRQPWGERIDIQP